MGKCLDRAVGFLGKKGILDRKKEGRDQRSYAVGGALARPEQKGIRFSQPRDYFSRKKETAGGRKGQTGGDIHNPFQREPASLGRSACDAEESRGDDSA